MVVGYAVPFAFKAYRVNIKFDNIVFYVDPMYIFDETPFREK
jgi:hypothetical protein